MSDQIARPVRDHRVVRLLEAGATYHVAVAVALAVFWLGFDGGSYAQTSRDSVAIVIWWAVIVALGFGMWPHARVPTPALAAGAALAALAAVTLASVAWAESAERAYAEFSRVSLYLGVFVVAVVASARRHASRWSDGIAIGIAVLGLLGLASRFFPAIGSLGEVRSLLPAAYTRLSYPVGYWNGLAILMAISLPLLLRAAVTARNGAIAGLAVAPLPALAGVIYLTSSRAGVATAVAGILTFFALSRRRWSTATAAAVAAAGSAVTISVLLDRPELVNGPLETATSAGQGESAAAWFAIVALVTGVVYGLGYHFLRERVRPPAVLGRGLVIAATILALGGIVAADPARQFDEFRSVPSTLAADEEDYVRAHLLSVNGNGRWQFWRSAADQFQTAPLAGRGAGSFESWWAEHGTVAGFVLDAHSLYLETLGELGVLGAAVLLSLFAVAFASAARRLLQSDDDTRNLIAALGAALVAFALGAAVDWMWELTVVSVVGVAIIGLLTGPATVPFGRLRAVEDGESRPPARRRFGLGVAVIGLGWVLICAHGLPLLATMKIRDSQAAAGAGDTIRALQSAVEARDIQPWAASPYLQVALVNEDAGRLGPARSAIYEAIDRDRKDWRFWLVAARLETKTGHVRAAGRNLRQAAMLNPRSPLFARVRSAG